MSEESGLRMLTLDFPLNFIKGAQFAVKIEPQSVLACFTHWVLPYQMVKSGLNGLHKLQTIKILFICHELPGKSGTNTQSSSFVAALGMEHFYKGQHIFKWDITFDRMRWGKDISTIPARVARRGRRR